MGNILQTLIDEGNRMAKDRYEKDICEYPGELAFRIDRFGSKVRYAFGYLNVNSPQVGQKIEERGDFIPLIARSESAKIAQGLNGEVEEVIRFLGSHSNQFHIIKGIEIYKVAEFRLRYQNGQMSFV
jgi:hypothetical protein